jgi:hypothetical protein
MAKPRVMRKTVIITLEEREVFQITAQCPWNNQ